MDKTEEQGQRKMQQKFRRRSCSSRCCREAFLSRDTIKVSMLLQKKIYCHPSSLSLCCKNCYSEECASTRVSSANHLHTVCWPHTCTKISGLYTREKRGRHLQGILNSFFCACQLQQNHMSAPNPLHKLITVQQPHPLPMMHVPPSTALSWTRACLSGGVEGVLQKMASFIASLSCLSGSFLLQPHSS